jgi:HD-GYP domain-containing protein (c-di-GMP phosphodiesterase class II)
MTSDRPYRPALAADVAIAELEKCSGGQFDPDVVEVFVEAWRQGALVVHGGALRAAAS